MGLPDYLLWLDLETTGSDVNQDCIIEIGCRLTTPDLEYVTYDTPPNEPWSFSWLVEPETWPWVRMLKNPTVHAMHTANGLIDEIVSAWHTGIVLKEPEEVSRILVEELERRGVKPHKAILAGSGVAHFDSRFLREDMPELGKYLAYPILDVGVVRRALKMWLPLETLYDWRGQAGDKPHRALPDVDLHISEARFYKTLIQGDGHEA